MLVREASRIILDDLRRLGEVLKKRAFEFKDTVMVGRTHGVHAEPITFGLKLANWFAENRRNLIRMERAAEERGGGKNSGGGWDLSPPPVRKLKRKFAADWGCTPRRFRARSSSATGTLITSPRWP